MKEIEQGESRVTASEQAMTRTNTPMMLAEMRYSRGGLHREQARTAPTDDREERLLLWLLHHPLQRTKDITIMFDTGYWATYRLLTSLVNRGLAEYVTPSLDRSMTARWYYLTSEGIRAAVAQEKADPRRRAHAWGADEHGLMQLLPRFHTLLEVQEVVTGLIEHAPRMFAYQGGHPAGLTWSWTRDYRYGFTFHLRDAQCMADAALAFRVKDLRERIGFVPASEEWRCLFLFADLGQAGFMSKDLITQRLENLLRYREAEERIPYRVFPPVLVLVHSPRQQEVWMQCANAVIASFRIGKPLLGAVACLPGRQLAEKEKTRMSRTSVHGRKNDQVLCDSPWLFNWRSLDSGQPCRLQEVLVPMPKEALPPGIRVRRTDEVTDPPKNKHAIVVGQFTRRAAQLDLVKGALSHEREVIALLGLRFAQRYSDLFLQTYVTPLMSTKELGLVVGLSRRVARRYLADLEDWGLTQHVSLPRDEWRWVLTERGLRYLAASQNVSILHLMEPRHTKNSQGEQPTPAIPQRGASMLYRYLRHTAGVYSVIRSFYEAAQRHPGHRVRWWETWKRCERHYLYNGKHWHNFRPDATLEYEVTETESVLTQRFLLWIEWDGGTMNAKNLEEKLSTYNHYIHSGQWRTSRLQKIPLLLIVVPHKSQFDLFVRAAHTVLAEQGLFIRMTTSARLVKDGPLAPIWTPIWPKLARDGEERRALFDLNTLDQQMGRGP